MSVEGRSVLIIGGTSGLGYATAKSFVNRDARTMGHCNSKNAVRLPLYRTPDFGITLKLIVVPSANLLRRFRIHRHQGTWNRREIDHESATL